MTLDLSLTSIIAFSTVLSILTVFSIMDIRERKVANQYLLVAGGIGVIIIGLTGHLIQNPLLHLAAPIFVTILAYVLFQIGAIGGADLKVLIIMSVISPGIELALWTDAILEAVIGGGLEMLIMLTCGYVYSNWSRKEDDTQRAEKISTPLIPFLVIAYVLIQTLALL
ncbi:MAG: prepilin peptidase [Candidatus Thorarchaeota archaeon]|jgi:Flp pilus assembly protein protease CpaA